MKNKRRPSFFVCRRMKITGSSGDRERIAIFVPNGRDMEEFIKKMRETYPVSDGALQLFLRHTERVTLPKGHLLIRDGVVEKYSYFIVRDGKDATIWFATAGMSLLSMNAYLFRSSGYENVELLEECDLLKISNETLDGLFEKEVELANWGRRMSDRIILRMERLFVERYFLTAAERYRLLVEREPEILQKAPLRDITSYLGISQVSLSRIRAGVQ